MEFRSRVSVLGIRERGREVDGPEVERWKEVRNAVANDQVVVVDIGSKSS
jgi:hypothetical protein